VRSAAAVRGSRANWRGSRVALLLVSSVVVALAAGGAGYWASTRAAPAASPPERPAAAKYGGLPAWLPKATIPVDRVAQASPAHPWLAIEGDTVSVHLTASHVLVTAVGPAVPATGQFPVPSTSPCTFTVTFTGASGVILLRASDFPIVDELGLLHWPRVTAQGGRPLPANIDPGQKVTLILNAVLPTGNGTLRWTAGTASAVVSWDFSVEVD
jgi:hypothetical protein